MLQFRDANRLFWTVTQKRLKIYNSGIAWGKNGCNMTVFTVSGRTYSLVSYPASSKTKSIK